MTPDLPLRTCGAPVDEVGAELVRDRWRDNHAPRVRVHGAHVAAGSSYGNEIVLRDRAQLKKLIDELQGAYYGWPGDER